MDFPRLNLYISRIIAHPLSVMPKPSNRSAKVPVFQLYGENGQWLTPELVHCEAIATRSRLHNWEIRPHSHHGLFQLLWLEQGQAGCQLDADQLALAGGSALLVPQHCVHGFQFSTDARGLVVTIAYALLGSLGNGLADGLAEEVATLSAPRHFVLSEADGAIESVLRSLQREYENGGRFRQVVIHSLLSCALGWLLRQEASQRAEDNAVQTRASQHVARFSALVESDFAAHVSLEHYAHKLDIGAAHLNALCRQVTGHSALELIHARLMLEAKRMLIYTSTTVGEVADALGFADPAYFTRFFRQRAGLSPRDFRRQAEAWREGEG